MSDQPSESDLLLPQTTCICSTDTPTTTPSSPKQHNHSSNADKATRKLWIASALCFTFFIVELVGGIFSNSLAILSDSFHLLSDLSGFLISLFSIHLARRKATKTHSFGFHRAETIGALGSILLIWIVTGILIVEAIDRLKNPQPLNGEIMLGVSILGLFVNLILIFALGHGHHSHSHDHGHGTDEEHGEHDHGTDEEHGEHDHDYGHDHGHSHGHNINLKAAIIHIIGDVVQSIGVIISSIILILRPEWVIIDPICTFLFSIIVMFTTFALTREAISVLMEGTPKHIDPHQVERDLKSIPNVLAVHDLHIWSLTVGQWALACHIEVPNDVLMHEYESVLESCQELMCSKYKVHHTTFQLELSSDSAHCKSSLCNGGVCEGVSIQSEPVSPDCPVHAAQSPGP